MARHAAMSPACRARFSALGYFPGRCGRGKKHRRIWLTTSIVGEIEPASRLNRIAGATNASASLDQLATIFVCRVHLNNLTERRMTCACSKRLQSLWPHSRWSRHRSPPRRRTAPARLRLLAARASFGKVVPARSSDVGGLLVGIGTPDTASFLDPLEEPVLVQRRRSRTGTGGVRARLRSPCITGEPSLRRDE